MFRGLGKLRNRKLERILFTSALKPISPPVSLPAFYFSSHAYHMLISVIFRLPLVFFLREFPSSKFLTEDDERR